MKKHIPNTLTSLNLLSGCIAATMAFQGLYLWVVVWVVIASLFDFSDGFAARILKAYSPTGKELDSLADMVSFGFVPGITVFKLLSDHLYAISSNPLILEYLPYIAFMLTVFSGLRLAKFNIDERQTDSFIGLNTPANALFWVSLCYGLTDKLPVISSGLVYTVLVGVVLFSLLLVSEVPMFSLKVKSFKIKGNELRYLLILSTIAFFIIFGISGIACTILLYITLSIIGNKVTK